MRSLSKIVLAYRLWAPIGFDPRAEGEPPAAPALDLAILPEDIRGEPSLAAIKTIPDLAKGYVSAQKLIGTKRLPAPDNSWSEGQWNEFYKAIGRPESADKYGMPDVKLEDGLSIDDKALSTTRQEFHKLGLTDKQARGVMSLYMTRMNETHKGSKAAADGAAAQATAKLKEEWGDKYDTNIDLAKATIRKFGDQEFLDYVNGSMGNNVQLIRTLAKIGKLIAEDSARGGGADFAVKDSTRAVTEIDNLKTNEEFMKALFTREHQGHAAAVERWRKLHEIAHPGKVTE